MIAVRVKSGLLTSAASGAVEGALAGAVHAISHEAGVQPPPPGGQTSGGHEPGGQSPGGQPSEAAIAIADAVS